MLLLPHPLSGVLIQGGETSSTCIQEYVCDTQIVQFCQTINAESRRRPFVLASRDVFATHKFYTNCIVCIIQICGITQAEGNNLVCVYEYISSIK